MGQTRSFSREILRISLQLTPAQIQAGTDAIRALTSVGVVANPENYIPTLGEPVPQWLFWVIMERIREAGIVKQGKA